MLFDHLQVAKAPSYKEHLNQYDVIYLDMTGIKPYTHQFESLVPFLIKVISEEIKAAYPDIVIREDLSATLAEAVDKSGSKFIMVIDEWDAPIRENPDSQSAYLEFLRSLFKKSGTTSKVFAAVYMTGILPIKKDGSQSAISDFNEYTMIAPRAYGEYVGFTEEEVQMLCRRSGADYEKMKKWYDGYLLRNIGSIYNPNSVMQAIENQEFESYWTETSAAESLMHYISQDYHGLTKTVAELIGGIDVPVDTNGFANDLTTFHGRNDVLTLLIHLGYLAYDADRKTVHIPNEEIKLAFQKSVRTVRHEATMKRLEESDRLFTDTIHMNAEAVARQVEKIHREETAPIHYNKEESLRSVIKLAYYTYRDYYLQFEELPSGDGYADIVYLPQKDSEWPALVIELKWNQSAGGAIAQILDRHYPEALEGYGGEILLVGISYEKGTSGEDRRHTCQIRRYKK